MAVPITFTQMFNLVISELSRIPRESVAQLAVLSIVSEAVGVAAWRLQSPGDSFLLGLSFLLGIAGLAIAYATSMRMIDQPRTRRGLIRYAATALLMLVPPFVALGMVVFGTVTSQSGLVLAGLGIALISLAVLPMLAAWPVLQSVSPRLIGPAEAFRRSRGMRWPLLMMTLVISGGSRVLPATLEASTLPEALFSALLNAAFGVAAAAVVIAVGVAAFRHTN